MEKMKIWEDYYYSDPEVPFMTATQGKCNAVGVMSSCLCQSSGQLAVAPLLTPPSQPASLQVAEGSVQTALLRTPRCATLKTQTQHG